MWRLATERGNNMLDSFADLKVMRAGLMNLPAEIRLQMYRHLFTGNTARGRSDNVSFASILATNKQLFCEAMPVLYNKSEVELYVEFGETEQHRRVKEALHRLPPYCLEYITTVQLRSKKSKAWSPSTYWFNDRLGPAAGDWEDLRDHLPSLTTLRVELSVSKGDIGYIDYSNFEHVLTLPSLKRLDIQVLSDARFSPTMAELEAVSSALSTNIMRKVDLGKKQLEVQTSTRNSTP